MKTGRHERMVLCPYCGYENDGYAGPNGEEPKPNDLSICIACSGLSLFQEPGKGLRKPSGEELVECMRVNGAEIAAARRRIEEMKHKTRWMRPQGGPYHA